MIPIYIYIYIYLMVLPFSRWCGYQTLQAADLLGHVVTTGWLHIIKASPKQLHPPSPSRAAQGHWGRPPDPHHRGRRSSRRPQNPKKESWVKWTNCNCWDQWPPPIKQDTVSFSVLLSTLPWRSWRSNGLKDLSTAERSLLQLEFFVYDIS